MKWSAGEKMIFIWEDLIKMSISSYEKIDFEYITCNDRSKLTTPGFNTDECFHDNVNSMFADVHTMWGIISSADTSPCLQFRINIPITGIADSIVEIYTYIYGFP